MHRHVTVRPLVALGLLLSAQGLSGQDDVVLQSTTVASGQVVSQQDNLTITAQNSYVIQSGGQGTFRARLKVNLKPTFAVNSGGSFQAAIDYNLNGVTDWTEEQSAVAIPYITSFEGSEGFTLGGINGQKGWYSGPGVVSIAQDGFDGAAGVVIPPRNPANSVIRYFRPPAQGPIVFVDLWTKPHASASVSTSTLFDFGGALVAAVNTSGQGKVQVLNGDGLGAGTWIPVGVPSNLNAIGQYANWTRFSLRLDYSVGTWDLYLNGILASHSNGLDEAGVAYMRVLQVYGGTQGDTAFDYLYVNTANPLFTDVDKDGIDDVWETQNGLNPSNAGDRLADADGDGLANIEEFRRSADADGDGIADGWEIAYNLDPLSQADGGMDGDDDGFSNLLEFRLGTNPSNAAVIDYNGQQTGLRVHSPVP